MARSRELKVVISGDAKGLSKAFASAGSGASALESKIGKASAGIGRSLTSMGKIGAVAVGGGLVVALKGSIDAFAEAEKVAAQTTAVLKSTGGAANVTAKQIGDLATAISKKSGMDDEAVQSGENLLLTFTNIQNVAGKGNDIFTQTVGIMADMSTALGQDTKSSAIQLGKALNDPVKGVTALQRVGVSFTKSQKDQIKTLVGSGRTLDAQKLILKELTKEFGGSAKAAGDTFAGKIDKAKVSLGNLGEAIGGVVAPALGDAAEGLADFVDKLATSDRPAKFFAGVGDAAGKARDAIVDVFDDIGKARQGGASLGAAIGGEIADTVAKINWSSIGKKVSAGVSGAVKALGSVAGGIGDAVVVAMGRVDWKAVGATMSAGLSTALDFTGKLPAAISDGIGVALEHVDTRKVGAAFAGVIAEALGTLADPGFWLHHLGALFSTITFVIPIGKILKIPGFGFLFKFISEPIFKAVAFVSKGLVELLGRAGSVAFTAFLAEIEKFAPRIANMMLKLTTISASGLKTLPSKVSSWAGKATGAIADKLGDGAGRAAAAMVRVVARAVAALGRGVGALAGVAARIVKAIGGKLDDLLGNVPSTIARAISRGVSAMAQGAGRIASAAGQIGKKIVDKIVEGVKGLPGKLSGAIKKGIAGAAGAVGSALDKINPFGDGIGQAISTITAPAIPGGGMPNLMGAQAALAPFAAVGSKFGLHVSSGRRSGAITSSGNQSYHSTGEAIDVAGSPAGMMGFFRYMKSRFGSRLAELIYSPGGPGIKDGHPFQYTGAVAKDHYDHVHVALDTGQPGVGDGIGISRLVKLATGAGFSGAQAKTMAAIAMAESHGDPNATNHNKDGSIDRGLWQINSSHNFKSNLFSPSSNAAAARSVFKDQGFGAWVTYKSGAYRKYLDQARDIKVQSSTDRTAAQERSGSRIVNSLVDKFLGGKSGGAASARSADRIGTSIEDNDRSFGQVERLFDRSDEDLGTPEGRAKRTTELKALQDLKKKQLAREKRRASALQAAISKYEGLIKSLNSRLKANGKNRVRGAARAKIHTRIKSYEDRLDELKAELKSLGFDITDTQLDIGDIAAQITDVNTPDAADTAGGAADGGGGADGSADGGGVTAYDIYQGRLHRIDQLERAGMYTPEQAARDRANTAAMFIGGQFGAITDDQRLDAQGDLKQFNDGIAELTDAVTDSTAVQRQLLDVQQQIADNQTKILAMASQGPEILAAVVAAVSGGIGGKTGLGFQSVGYAGGVARY